MRQRPKNLDARRPSVPELAAEVKVQARDHLRLDALGDEARAHLRVDDGAAALEDGGGSSSTGRSAPKAPHI